MASPIREKVYRFALYGRGNAGKTCILAALAMPRLASPGRFSCSWVERPGPGDLASLGVRNPAAMEGFERGRAWLERAIWHLEHHGEIAPSGGGDSDRSRGVPPPNPNEGDAFRLLYRFTAPERGSFLVELIDYSGELIDPDVSETELAKRLRHHLADTDALVVLASAPRLGDEGGDLVRELERLKRAFAALRGERRRGPAIAAPVVLALNKWDRRQSRDAFLAEPELDGDEAHFSKPAVREFISGTPEPPHLGLVNELKNAVGPGNFKAFPLSALGEPEAGGDASHPDRPARLNPLHAFGVEDPFVWACRRRDEIDLAEYEREAASKTLWKVWQPFSPRSWWSRRTFVARFPEGTPGRRRVEVARSRIRRSTAAQIVLSMSLAVAAFLGVTLVADWVGSGRHRPAFDNPTQANADELLRAETWLVGYIHSPNFRHASFRPFFGGGEASAKLNIVRQERARRECCDVEVMLQKIVAEFDKLVSANSEDIPAYTLLRADVDRLEAYRDSETPDLTRRRLNFGKTIDDRIATIRDVVAKRTVKDATDVFISLKTRADNAMTLDEIQASLTALREKEKLVVGDVLADVRRQYAKSIDETKVRYDDLIKITGIGIILKNIRLKLDRGDIAEAAEDLVALPREAKEIDGLRQEFPDLAAKKITERTEVWLREGNWAAARRKLAEWSNDRSVKSLLTEDQVRAVANRLPAVNEAEDRYLYDKVFDPKTRSADAINRYLAQEPAGAMKKQVEAHRKYVAEMAGPLKFKFTATILWGPKCWEEENSVNIKFLGHDVVDAAKIKSQRTGTTDLTSKWTANLNDDIIFGADIRATSGNFVFSKSSQGSSRDEVFPVHAMRGQGKIITLDKFDNRIMLLIDETSLPQDPGLPAWSKP